MSAIYLNSVYDPEMLYFYVWKCKSIDTIYGKSSCIFVHVGISQCDWQDQAQSRPSFAGWMSCWSPSAEHGGQVGSTGTSLSVASKLFGMAKETGLDVGA